MVSISKLKIMYKLAFFRSYVFTYNYPEEYEKEDSAYLCFCFHFIAHFVLVKTNAIKKKESWVEKI